MTTQTASAAWAAEARQPAKDARPDRVQRGARREVLAQLKANPTIMRAFVHCFESDGTMIIGLAIRRVGNGELTIMAARSSRNALGDCEALLWCMEGAG